MVLLFLGLSRVFQVSGVILDLNWKADELFSTFREHDTLTLARLLSVEASVMVFLQYSSRENGSLASQKATR